jgi:hypothetical protein
MFKTPKILSALAVIAASFALAACGEEPATPKPATKPVEPPVVMSNVNVVKETFHIISKDLPAPMAAVLQREVKSALNSGIKKNWEVVQTPGGFPAGVPVSGVIAVGTADNIPPITSTPKPPVVVINPTGTVAKDILVVTDGNAADTKDLTPELLADVVSGKVAGVNVHDYVKLARKAAEQARTYIREEKPEASVTVPVLTVTKANAESAEVKALLP